MTINMDEIVLINKNIKVDDLKKIASKRHGDLIKAVVDVEKGIIAIGGEMHADEEQFLLGNGSKQQNLWGINIYPDLGIKEWIEFDSMINIRPKQNNCSRTIEDETLQNKIKEIVSSLVERQD
jgi:hypothetical protein